MYEDLSKLFDEMILFGAFGIYIRDSTKDMPQTALSSKERLETRGSKAIHKATINGAFLNIKYSKQLAGQRIFPQTDNDLYNMFAFPINDILEQLPDDMKEILNEESEYIGIEPLVELIGDGKGFTTEELDYFIYSKSFEKACRSSDIFGELREQQVFRLMVEGDYNFIRLFLESSDNGAIPIMQLKQTAEQKKFITENGKLFDLCYHRESNQILYRCPTCGAILKLENNEYRCYRKACNRKLEKKKRL